MKKWTKNQAREWYSKQPWLVGCNFLPSTAINQLEMFQSETFDPDTLKREIGWAKELGFNTLRVYLHDLLWEDNSTSLCRCINDFLDICNQNKIRPILVLFDDCHRDNPAIGAQPLPVAGVHNSGWKQSPGKKMVDAVNQDVATRKEINHLKDFVQGVMDYFSEDDRILMWDIYNEPGQFGKGENSLKLLKLVWKWAHETRPSQPLTSCLDGSVGKKIIALNLKNSDVISFHIYEGNKIESTIKKYLKLDRPIFCTEYMARELGSTFQYSLPIFKKYFIPCYSWGLVAGKSQTHFNWASILNLKKFLEEKKFVSPRDPIPEPKIWFHDILRVDGSAYDEAEVKFIKSIIVEK